MLPMTPAEQASTPVAQPWYRRLANLPRLGTIGITMGVLLLGWQALTGRNGLNSWHAKSTEEKALQQEIQQLTDENAHLQLHIERLRQNPAAIEDEARRRLRYTRPNEVIYKLPETTAPGR
jgi:cell division protein FtsB